MRPFRFYRLPLPVCVGSALSEQYYVFHYRDLKVIILGAASVGKTCFMQRYMTGQFNVEYVPVGIYIYICNSFV